MSHTVCMRDHTSLKWYNDLLLEQVHLSVSKTFKEYKAAKILQKYARGFITRCSIKKWHRSATVIQKTWRGFRIRVHALRYARKRYYESRDQYYNNMSARIQRAWRVYKERMDPNSLGTVHFFKEAKKANRLMVERMHQFYKKEMKRQLMEAGIEKTRWLNYALPKLHHLIRTKAIPGIFSLKDGSTKLSMVEILLSWYNFTKFIGELNEERRKNIDYYQSHVPDYRWLGLGSFKRDERAWNRKYVIRNPKL